MSEALCQCGHGKASHDPRSGWCHYPLNECNCTRFEPPPPTREPIRLTDDEQEQLLDAIWAKRDDGAKGYPVMRWGIDFSVVESILAARLAGGPTLADARTPESEDTE